MTTTIKVSHSLDAPELSWMRKSARRSGTNLSALFSRSAQRRRLYL